MDASLVNQGADDDLFSNNGEETVEDEVSPETSDGFFNFRSSRQAKGTLYKLSPMSDDVQSNMHKYVHGGAMDNDLRFAREVFGLVNTSGRKDFTTYWESPWIEEHIRDMPKKRKMLAQQKSMAARAYIQESTANDPTNINQLMANVDALSKWEDMDDSSDNVKTVSRLVQSFERVAVRYMISFLQNTSTAAMYTRNIQYHFGRLRNGVEDDVTPIAYALRRSDVFFDLFALCVAMEISWADATSGTRNLSVKLTEEINKKRDEATYQIIRRINAIENNDTLRVDEIGMPLMKVNYNLCVSRGVLLVGPGSANAIYVLDIDGYKNPTTGNLDLTGVKTIVISQQYSGEFNKTMEAPQPTQPPERRISSRTRSNAVLTPITSVG